MNNSQLIASLLLFKALHDNNRDIYDVIAAILRRLITSKSLWQFNATEVRGFLQEEFGIKLPVEVIRSTLKHRMLRPGILESMHGMFIIKDMKQFRGTLWKEADYKNLRIFREIEEKIIPDSGYFAKTGNRKDLKNQFREYLLGNAENEKFSTRINRRITKYGKEKGFREKLMIYREALLLFQGLTYSPVPFEDESQTRYLHIFPDAELLFDFAGYNGKLKYEHFMDFYRLFSEAKMSGISPVKLKLGYLPETEARIIQCFNAAIHFIEGKAGSTPEDISIKGILNGCRYKSDILAKKNRFFHLLRSAGIEKEARHNDVLFAGEKSNNMKILKELKQVCREYKISTAAGISSHYMKLFTVIARLRENIKTDSLENCGYILLTANTYALLLARCPRILKTGSQPLALDQDYISNKLWFWLQKGLFTKDRHVSIDLLSRVQLILAGLINERIYHNYLKMHDKFLKETLSRDEALSLNAELRKVCRENSEIKAVKAEEGLEFMEAFRSEKQLAEIELLQQKTREGEEAINKLRTRERSERKERLQNIKRKYRMLTGLLHACLFLPATGLLWVFYLLAERLREPGDTLLSIAGLLITLLASLPIYTAMKYFSGIFRKWTRRRFKRKLYEIFRVVFW